ncbi:MAG: hypothetical protein GY859_08785, partial [Desulfobacterales bacterium]|nr:hypothetical protein [Desulfobacterales bacterium]
LFSSLLVILLAPAALAGVSAERYPHWDANDPAIQTVDAFIQAHKGKGYVAAFDWDGTLYSETIKVKGKMLAKGCDPANPDLEQCRIAGNCAKLSPGDRFTMVYDDRFVRVNSAGHPYFLERNIIDGAGKAVAIRNYILPRAQKPVVFYAGNSGGDYESVQYVLKQEGLKTLVVAVNPGGTLNDLVAKYQTRGNLVKVSAAPAKE